MFDLLAPRVGPRIILGLAIAVGSGGRLLAQSTNFDLAVRTNPHATAASVGLPEYPGARIRKHDGSDGSFDLQFSTGDSTFRLLGISYETADSPDKILAFYRQPLSRFGEVLECDHGKAVGPQTSTRSGLTCSSPPSERESSRSGIHAYSSNDRELRAGSPNRVHIVSAGDREADRTSFVLLYLRMPEDKDSSGR